MIQAEGPSRRRFLAQSALALAAPAFAFAPGCAPRRLGRGRLCEIRPGADPIRLIAAERPLSLGAARPLPAWLYGERVAPVYRVKQGAPFSARLVNHLPEPQHSTIHWHGIRLQNAMDGVPFLTQRPVYPGEEFVYRFIPPDAGSFFFHPHCNTVEQLGRGLAGLLVVEGDESVPYDDDIVCALKDWRVGEDGTFLPFMMAKGAANAGSFGTVRTVNGQIAPLIDVPAGANIRLRLYNIDSTRLSELGIEGAEAAVIAIDGNPVGPFAFSSWKLGPAMRLDLALRTGHEGQSFTLIDYYAAEPVPLARFVPRGPRLRKDDFAPRPLRRATFAAPDLSRARQIELRLGVGIGGAQEDRPLPPPIRLPNGESFSVLDSLCTVPQTFWTLGGRSWPGRDHKEIPPPLFTAKRGETIALTLTNTTAQTHPVHLHGHTFRVLSISRLKRPVHDADTVLVTPNERVEIAFVADNPGDWMIHCHIIEHQETGMMGWFRVS